MAEGTRMGTLLDESFHRHTYRSTKVPPGPRVPLEQGMTLKDAQLGVVFNTTLAGTKLTNKAADPTQAGYRLVVTNVRTDANTFPIKQTRFPELATEYLHYVVVDDPQARLTTGAALSANFPPVFSNAAVDVKAGADAGRYWVTDGGAAENRGALSLLYILLQALREEARKPEGQRRPPLPIQIVIAEASAVSLDFTQDRGVGAALGAAEKFASELGLELLRKVRVEYVDNLKGKPDELDVHFLPMPLVLRSRGGVGTHWKLPAYVTIANPLDKNDTLILSDIQTRALIMDLYLPEGDRYLDKAQGAEKKLLDLAWTWIEGTEADERYRQHRENWKQLDGAFRCLGFQPKDR
jgi:hypothetical protein